MAINKSVSTLINNLEVAVDEGADALTALRDAGPEATSARIGALIEFNASLAEVLHDVLAVLDALAREAGRPDIAEGFGFEV